jgi:CBS domain-containing protein
MKTNVVSISETARIRDAAAVFVRWHVGLLPVVDNDNRLVGVVGLPDMMTLELPDFIRFIADVDFVHDFGAVETTRPAARTLDQPIKVLMKPAISVPETTGLLRAYALMVQHNLHDMPVVSKDRRLAGITSRVDIGVAILSTWNNMVKE